MNVNLKPLNERTFPWVITSNISRFYLVHVIKHEKSQQRALTSFPMFQLLLASSSGSGVFHDLGAVRGRNATVVCKVIYRLLWLRTVPTDTEVFLCGL